MATRKKLKINRTGEIKSERKKSKTSKTSRAVADDNEGEEDRKARLKRIFGEMQFSIENILTMSATGFVLMPAGALYEKKLLKEAKEVLERCHVYIVGTLPKVEFIEARREGRIITAVYEAEGVRYALALPPLPDGAKMVSHKDGAWTLTSRDGRTATLSKPSVILQLVAGGMPNLFEVLYVGQAFGKNGSRHAVTRLLKHETLQEISIKGIPSDRELFLCLLEVGMKRSLATVINPFAKNKKNADKRIEDGLHILRYTTEVERTALYEAALIRYFRPQFNEKLKDSFPSTNFKHLKKSYKQDIGGVAAELDLIKAPFVLFSDDQEPNPTHLAYFDLHKDEDRKLFFSKNTEKTKSDD